MSIFCTVIIIGRHQLPVEALEFQAACLWWDSEDELVLTGKQSSQIRGFRMRDTNKKIGVYVEVCADSRAQLINHLLRECESLQALDRLRVIHNSIIKNVFLLCKLPLDITVDRLVNLITLTKWKNSIEKALILAGRTDHNVLPLSAEYLVEHYPRLFASKSTAKNKVGEVGLAQTIESIKASKQRIMFNNKEYHLITYRVPNEKGKDKKALIPSKMIIEVALRHLKAVLKCNVMLCDSTIPKRGFARIKLSKHYVATEADTKAELYDSLPKHYDPHWNEMSVTIVD